MGQSLNPFQGNLLARNLWPNKIIDIACYFYKFCLVKPHTLLNICVISKTRAQVKSYFGRELDKHIIWLSFAG
ncbi:MAG: hypothetical protein ACJA2S_000892 [Cyclobacteriaceae bacterium]|jgi:hypothetical protein